MEKPVCLKQPYTSNITGLRIDEPQSKMIPEMVDQKKLPKKKRWMLCGIFWKNHDERKDDSG